MISFSYHATGYAAGALIALSLLVYLLLLRSKQRLTRMFCVYLFLCLGFLVRSSTFWADAAKPASYLIALYTCFSNAVLLHFLYNFPVNARRKESRIVVIVFAAFGAAAYCYYLISTVANPVVYNPDTLYFEFQTPESARPMGLLHTVGFLWILVVGIRKVLAEEGEWRLAGCAP